MTSGNVSDEPIAYRDEDALERLPAIADLFLVHDRPIETRTDDSVVRVVAVGEQRRPLPLRRSRGYVPDHLALPVAARAAAARLRRRAEEHLLRGQGLRGPGSATTSATSSTSPRCRPSATASPTSSGCSR